jgi:hypothetical protein
MARLPYAILWFCITPAGLARFGRQNTPSAQRSTSAEYCVLLLYRDARACLSSCPLLPPAMLRVQVPYQCNSDDVDDDDDGSALQQGRSGKAVLGGFYVGWYGWTRASINLCVIYYLNEYGLVYGLLAVYPSSLQLHAYATVIPHTGVLVASWTLQFTVWMLRTYPKLDRLADHSVAHGWCKFATRTCFLMGCMPHLWRVPFVCLRRACGCIAGQHATVACRQTVSLQKPWPGPLEWTIAPSPRGRMP